MALLACIDIALCVDRFHSIGICDPITFLLQFAIESQSKDIIMPIAMPYSIISNNDLIKISQNTAKIDCQTNLFTTSMFKLQGHAEERVNIKEICNFRILVPAQQLDQKGLNVICWLMAVGNSILQVDKIIIKTKRHTGISTYLPIFFTNSQNSSFVDVIMHTQLTNFKFCLLKAESEELKDKKIAINPRFGVSNVLCGQQHQSELKPKTLLYQSFEAYLSRNCDKPNKQSIFSFLSRILQTLRINFNQLKQKVIDLDAQNKAESIEENMLKLSKVYTEHSKQDTESINQFLVDINDLSGKMYEVWNLFVKENVYFLNTCQEKAIFQEQYEHYFKRFVFKNIGDDEINKVVTNCFSRSEYVVGDLVLPKLNNIFIIDKRSQDVEDDDSNDTDVEQICYELLEVRHLYVLVHGYNANRLSLQRIKNALRYHHPNVQVLISTSNEEETDDHIEQMGRRLAEQVKNHIHRENMKDIKLSFLGHSLGGIIIRACLPYLEAYRSKMHNLVTICTPHLGYLYHSNYIVKAGLWFINSWYSKTCMLMLSMVDKPNLRDTYLYHLSHRPGLQWFKHITFVTSPQDSYVNESSALVSGHMNALEDARKGLIKGQVYREMLHSIMSRVSANRVTKISCVFENLEAPFMDKMVGRVAHNVCLWDYDFINLLMLGCKKSII